MSKDLFPHQLLPPSQRYPTWEGTGRAGLSYLGWGERNYSSESIPIHSNPGWTYWILLHGEVEVNFPKSSHVLSEGQGLLCGPKLPFGFPSQAAGPVEILIWIWKETPSQSTTPAANAYATFAFSQDQTRLLKALHEQTRIETLETSDHQHQTLPHIRALLDLCFQRALENNSEGPGHNRIRTARQWMLNNLGLPNPAASLARFLNVSPMTLHRLFVDELGESPGVHFKKLKMEQARRLLSVEGHSVKGVAYEMGYRYPQDFSRAYKTYFGTPPSNPNSRP